MSSTLRQLLTRLETSRDPLSLPQLAAEFNVSLSRIDEMLQYWVRKGRLRLNDDGTTCATGCGSCGSNGACPYIAATPRTFEVVSLDDIPILPR